MELIGILIPSILYLFSFALGIFIIIQNPKRRMLWYLGGTMLCGGLCILSYIFGRMDLPPSSIAFWTKILFITAESVSLLWLLFSCELSMGTKGGLRVPSLLLYSIIILNLVFLFLLVFTNILVNYANPIFVGRSNLVWDFYTHNIYLARTLLMAFKLIFPVITFALLLHCSSYREARVSFRLLTIIAILLAAGVLFSCLHFFFRVRYPSLYNIPEFIQEILILPAMLLMAWVILTPKLILSRTAGIVSDFLSYIGYSFILIIPYLVVILLAFHFFSSKELLTVVLLTVSGLVILTHSTHEWVLEFVKGSIRNKRLTIPSVVLSEVRSALANYSSPNKLADSGLLRLESVKKKTEAEGFSSVEALRKIIADAIESFKPRDSSNKRTLPRIKYEILRMMAFEGSGESQIMWDLGFDVYTRSIEEKMSHEGEPRFKLKAGSEYGATSDRSFKRLKKEAIEMLKWKLGQ